MTLALKLSRSLTPQTPHNPDLSSWFPPTLILWMPESMRVVPLLLCILLSSFSRLYRVAASFFSIGIFHRPRSVRALTCFLPPCSRAPPPDHVVAANSHLGRPFSCFPVSPLPRSASRGAASIFFLASSFPPLSPVTRSVPFSPHRTAFQFIFSCPYSSGLNPLSPVRFFPSVRVRQ